jgi:hypothetical protein
MDAVMAPVPEGWAGGMVLKTLNVAKSHSATIESENVKNKSYRVNAATLLAVGAMILFSGCEQSTEPATLPASLETPMLDDVKAYGESPLGSGDSYDDVDESERVEESTKELDDEIVEYTPALPGMGQSNPFPALTTLGELSGVIIEPAGSGTFFSSFHNTYSHWVHFDRVQNTTSAAITIGGAFVDANGVRCEIELWTNQGMVMMEEMQLPANTEYFQTGTDMMTDQHAPGSDCGTNFVPELLVLRRTDSGAADHPNELWWRLN